MEQVLVQRDVPAENKASSLTILVQKAHGFNRGMNG
jgi:hypothetical protein